MAAPGGPIARGGIPKPAAPPPAAPGAMASWHAMAATLWWMFAATRIPEHHGGFWRQVPKSWSGVPWGEALGAGLLVAPLRHLALLALAAACACAFAGLGAPVRSLLPGPAPEPRERRVLDLLFGFILLGAAHLGLALTGLFEPWLLWVLPVAGACLPGARRLAASVVGGLRGAALPVQRGPLALAFLPVVPAAILMLAPDAHVDTWSYHFLIPDQILKAHKYVMEGAPVAFGFPLTAELVYAPALAAGLDALPHWLQLAPFLAAVLQLAWWAERVGGPGAGWMAGAALFTFGHVQQMLVSGKNDLAAAAYPAAGALALARALTGERGWLAPSALLFGAGAAVKSSGQALAGLAFAGLALSAKRGAIVRWTALAAVPVLPWLVRSFAWWGDPLWPVLSARIPGALWGPEDAASVWIVRGRRSMLTSLTLAGPELVREFIAYQPALALTVPLVLAGVAALGATGRWLGGYAIAAMVMLSLLMASEWSRLAIPVFAVWAAAGAAAVRKLAVSWPPWFRAATLWIAAGLCWPPLGEYLANWSAPHPSVPYLAGAISTREYVARRMTTLDDVRGWLEARPPGGRMMAMGDIRFYRLPARFHSVRNYGSTWAWELSRDCATHDRIRIRFRQSNIRGVLYNFVTEGYPHPAAEPYPWTDRQIAVWREFVERWLDLTDRPGRVDHLNGGFVVYRVRRGAPNERPAWLPYLPGLESLYYTIVSSKDLRIWNQNALEVDRRAPGVDWIRDRVAMAPYNVKDYETAWTWYASGIAHDTIDDGNFWEGGIAALQTRRYPEAERAFRRAAATVPALAAEAARLADEIRRAVDDWEAQQKAAKKGRRPAAAPPPPAPSGGVLPK